MWSASAEQGNPVAASGNKKTTRGERGGGGDVGGGRGDGSTWWSKPDTKLIHSNIKQKEQHSQRWCQAV